MGTFKKMLANFLCDGHGSGIVVVNNLGQMNVWFIISVDIFAVYNNEYCKKWYKNFQLLWIIKFEMKEDKVFLARRDKQ